MCIIKVFMAMGYGMKWLERTRKKMEDLLKTLKWS